MPLLIWIVFTFQAHISFSFSCTILKEIGAVNEVHHCTTVSGAPKVTTRFQRKISKSFARMLGHRALTDTLAIASLASKLSKWLSSLGIIIVKEPLSSIAVLGAQR